VTKPCILVLTSTFPRWKEDVEPPFVFELSRRLTAWFDVRVLAPHAPGSLYQEAMEGIRVHRFRYAPAGWQRLAYNGGILANLRKSPLMIGLVPFFLSAQLLSAVRLLRRSPIDLIHAHWIFPQGMIAILARALTGSRSRVLCTSHGGDLYGLKGTVFRRIKKMVADASDHFTVVSRSMRSDLQKLAVTPEKISVVPMGVDLRNRFVPSGVASDTASILFVGRLVEKKGLKYLIKAMPKILERFPQSQLTVVGDGPNRFEMEKLTLDLRLSARIRFLGALKNEELPAVYQQAAVVVFPSVVSNDGDREGFGLVLVEALGCGRATVVTDLPAMLDIVQSRRTAIVVRQKNPEELSSAILDLLSNAGLRSAMAAEGRKHVLQHFDWPVIAERYRSTVLRIIA
jgi:glycosyltransferase involved in cell wall biosynthesis